MLAITGVTGFIGSYVAKHISFPLRVFVRRKDQMDVSSFAQVCEGDLRHPEALQPFVANTKCLIHLACSSNPRQSHESFTRDLEDNLIPTMRLFEAYAQKNPDGHIIFASTGGNMYADQMNALPKTEADLPAPRSAYAVHKLAAENYLRLIAATYKIRATILRISNPYGTLLPRARAQGLIGVAFAKLLASEVLDIFDSMETARDYVHLDDVASSFSLVIHNPPQIGQTSLYNISSGKGATISEVIGLIENATGSQFQVNYPSESRQKAPSSSILSFEKAKIALGWEPKITLKEGILRMSREIKS